MLLLHPLRPIPSTHNVAHKDLQLQFQGSDVLSWHPRIPGTQWCIYIHAGKISIPIYKNIYIIYMRKIFSWFFSCMKVSLDNMRIELCILIEQVRLLRIYQVNIKSLKIKNREEQQIHNKA